MRRDDEGELVPAAAPGGRPQAAAAAPPQRGVTPMCPGRTGLEMVPQEGFEPPTHALRMRCSTPELLRHPRSRRPAPLLIGGPWLRLLHQPPSASQPRGDDRLASALGGRGPRALPIACRPWHGSGLGTAEETMTRVARP